MSKRLSWIMLIGILAALLGAGVAAQEPEPYRFGDFVDVQLVNVEAWVTDRDGNPVRGLSADDFEVLEDGKPVTITHFAEIVGDRQVTRGVQAAAAEAGGEAPASRAPLLEPKHLVIYFDQLHLKAAGRNRLIEDLREFLREGQVPAEQVLILNQDFGLRTEASFGSSAKELDVALDRIARSAPTGGRVAMEKRLALQRLQNLWHLAQERSGARDPVGLCEFFLPQAVKELQLFARESRERVGVTMDHLASAASFLTGLRGVKTLIYVSDALERSPGADLLAFINGLCPAQDRTPHFIVSDELSRAFRQLTRHANANRVTVYALQASGLEGSFIGSASQRALEQQGTRNFDSALRLNERDGLTNLAAETGGRAVFNRNDFDAELTRIAREMSSYYSLAYQPPHGGDESEHKIEVRIRGRKLEVRHRQGYRDKSPDARMTERLRGAVYLGLVENPMDVRLGAGEVRVEGNGRVTVPLHVMVPAEHITFLPEGESVAAHLTMQLSTRNTKDQKGIFEQSAFRIRRESADTQELLSIVRELTLPEGVHLVAIGLRDDVSRQSSFVSTTLELSASAR